MNIKKVDDKPMVIHTKEKAKLHVKAAPETKLKGRNVLTVDRSPKIVGAVKETGTDKNDRRKSAMKVRTKGEAGKTADKDKRTSRTCEDIDEVTLSYAEIKAVATGNPLIKEKMQLENDVQRLKLLKNTYDSQKYSLEDNITIRFPKLIAAAGEKAECVRTDIKQAEAGLLSEPDFAVTIGKAKYTERVDGGTAMLEAVSRCKNGETTHLGTFKGFELLVEKNFIGVNYMVLRGKTDYKAEFSTSPVGNIVKLENLFGGIAENLDFLTKKIEQYQRDLEQSKTDYEKPFAQEAELAEKITRLNELNVQLDLENGKTENIDLAGQEKGGQSRVAESDTYHVRPPGKEGR